MLTYVISNNELEVKLIPNNDNDITVQGGGLDSVYKVLQMHFHWTSNGKTFGNGGSEHLINSLRYWGELHIVTGHGFTVVLVTLHKGLKSWQTLIISHDKANTKYDDNHTLYPDGLAVLGFFVDVSSIIWRIVYDLFVSQNRGSINDGFDRLLVKDLIKKHESASILSYSIEDLIGKKLSNFYRYEWV